MTTLRGKGTTIKKKFMSQRTKLRHRIGPLRCLQQRSVSRQPGIDQGSFGLAPMTCSGTGALPANQRVARWIEFCRELRASGSFSLDLKEKPAQPCNPPPATASREDGADRGEVSTQSTLLSGDYKDGKPSSNTNYAKAPSHPALQSRLRGRILPTSPRAVGS